MAPRKGEPGRFLYKELAAEFRTQILSGALTPGALLPSETVLTKERGLSNATVRLAYDLLKAEGLVATRQGKGVYVLDPKKLIRNAQRRFARDVRRSGKSIQSVDFEGRDPEVQVDVEVASDVPERVAELLGPGQMCRRRRIFSLDGRKLQLATSYVPADLAAEAGIDGANTGPGGMYERLAEVGRRPVKARERVYGRVAMPEEVEALGVSPGMSVFLIERVAYDEQDRIVEVNEMILDATKYVLEYDFPL